MNKNIVLNLFILIIVLSFLNCNDESLHNVEYSESPYKGEKLIISDENVYERNHDAKKVSQAYIPYEKTHDINAFVETITVVTTDEDNHLLAPDIKTTGVGKISGNKLSLSVYKIDDVDLWQWIYVIKSDKKTVETDGWKSFFREYPDAKIDNVKVKGNMILLDAYTGKKHEGMLDRQRVYGDSATITCETIMYIYVNGDCCITGTSNDGYTPGQYFYYTKGNLSLTLKKGINLVSRTETYGKNFNGTARVSMEIKNIINIPNEFKWTMEPGFELPGIHY